MSYEETRAAFIQTALQLIDEDDEFVLKVGHNICTAYNFDDTYRISKFSDENEYELQRLLEALKESN